MKKVILLVLTMVCTVLVSGCGSAHSEYYTIDHFYIKEEGDQFREAYDQMVVDTYRWYQSIEGSDGVYIIHYDHYDKELMEEWQRSGYMENIPEGDLDYFVLSVNYLEEKGFTFSEDDKEQIMAGVRCYLLPDTFTDEETEAMKRYLTEDALMGLDGDTLIDTPFRQDREIRFQSYHVDESFWTPDGKEVVSPVIYVASSNNMSYFEAESLVATGIPDSYLVLTESAYQKYVKEGLPQSLRDRKLTFSGIKNE